MVTGTNGEVVAIGQVQKANGCKSIVLFNEYAAGLTELDGFSHVMVVWWADRFEEYRFDVDMVIGVPYAPEVRCGLLATRSPVRPNPICVNTAKIVSVEVDKGRIVVDEIDAFDGTMVLDIKPYYGCIDRVKDYSQPDWVPTDWGVWYVPTPEMDYGE